MDVERIIDDIGQLEEMFEAPDIRPLSPSDLVAANRRHDEMLAHSPWFRLWLQYGVCCEVKPKAGLGFKANAALLRSASISTSFRIPIRIIPMQEFLSPTV